MTRRGLWLRIAANVVALVGLPYLFARWVASSVALEYEHGLRVSTDGDSISIPIAGFALRLLMVLVLVNAGVLVFHWFRQRRARAV